MLYNTCCCVRCSHTSLADLTSHSLPLAFRVATNYCHYLWVKCHLCVSVGCWVANRNCLPSARWSGGDISGHHTWLHQVVRVDSVAFENGKPDLLHPLHSLHAPHLDIREQHLSKFLANLQKYLYRECQKQKGGKQESALDSWSQMNHDQLAEVWLNFHFLPASQIHTGSPCKPFRGMALHCKAPRLWGQIHLGLQAAYR